METRKICQFSGNLVALLMLAQMATASELVEAAHRGSIRQVTLALLNGESPNTRDENGIPALVAAVSGGHLGVARVLLDEGADPNAPVRPPARKILFPGAGSLQVRPGDFPLRVAILRGRSDLVTLLLTHPKSRRRIQPDLTDSQGATPLILAASQGRVEMIREILRGPLKPGLELIGGDPPATALVHTIRAGCIACARELLDAGTEPDAVAPFEESRFAPPLIIALQERQTEIAHLLIDRGADPNAMDPLNRSALEIARDRGYKDIETELLARGALVRFPLLTRLLMIASATLLFFAFCLWGLLAILPFPEGSRMSTFFSLAIGVTLTAVFTSVLWTSVDQIDTWIYQVFEEASRIVALALSVLFLAMSSLILKKKWVLIRPH